MEPQMHTDKHRLRKYRVGIEYRKEWDAKNNPPIPSEVTSEGNREIYNYGEKIIVTNPAPFRTPALLS